MNQATVTVVGNLTADPELRYTTTGLAVVNFTIASTPRVLDKNSGEWKDGEPLFLRASLWRDYAVNVANSLTRGIRVIATGKLRQRSYETRDGEKRVAVEMEIEEIGPSLRFAVAKPQRMATPSPVPDSSGATESAPSDSWSKASAPANEWAGSGGNWNQPPNEDIPF